MVSFPSKNGAVGVAVAVFAAAALATPSMAIETAYPGLTIDIPVELTEAKVVMNIDAPAFEGDEPTGLSFLHNMSAQFKDGKVKASFIAVFHGGSGYMLLGDEAYDKARNWHGGNPYKEQIAALQKAGVQFEECGFTMAVHHWKNAEMLPGVKINTGANFRIVQLVQQGYVQLQP